MPRILRVVPGLVCLLLATGAARPVVARQRLHRAQRKTARWLGMPKRIQNGAEVTQSPVQYTRRNPLRFRSTRPFSQDQEHHTTLKEVVEDPFRDAQVSAQPLQH